MTKRTLRGVLVGVSAGLLTALPSTVGRADALTKTAPAERHFGVGVAFEGKAGVSLYGEIDPSHFLQGAFALGEEHAFLGTADYAFGYPDLLVKGLTPYYGLGAIAVHDPRHDWTHGAHSGTDDTCGGLRLPLGINYVLPHTPVQLSGEIVPTAVVAPVTYSYIQGGFNARLLF